MSGYVFLLKKAPLNAKLLYRNMKCSVMRKHQPQLPNYNLASMIQGKWIYVLDSTINFGSTLLFRPSDFLILCHICHSFITRLL